MNSWLLLLGSSILVVVYYDFIYTSLSASGSGFVSRFLTKGLWRCLLKLTGGKGSHRLLGHAGMLSMVTLILVWISLVWLGNTLLFWSAADSVLHTSSGKMATLWEKLYFVGYTLSTLGYGEFRPGAGGWQLLGRTGFLLGSVGAHHCHFISHAGTLLSNP
jgi:hypothetical protein